MPADKGTRLVERDNGVFYIVWPGEKRGRSTGTKERREAERALARHILGGQDAQRGGITVAEILADYDREHIGIKKVDPDGVARPAVANPKLERMRIGHLLAHFGSRLVAQLTQDDVASYVAARVSGKVGRPAPASESHRRELGLLKAAINHHLRRPPAERRLSADAAPSLKLPPTGSPRDVWLEEHESDALLLACFPGSYVSVEAAMTAHAVLPRIYVYMMLGLETAARPSAICELTWDRVDLAGGIIRFHIEGRRRTKKRRATVPISDRLRPVLERQRVLATNQYVLGDGGSVRTAFRSARERAAKALEAAGNKASAEKLRQKITPHCLRHTFATQALRNGVAIWDVAGVLGDTVETVRRTYGHHAPGYLRTAVNFRKLAPDVASNEPAECRPPGP
jgi:integrase